MERLREAIDAPGIMNSNAVFWVLARVASSPLTAPRFPLLLLLRISASSPLYRSSNREERYGCVYLGLRVM